MLADSGKISILITIASPILKNNEIIAQIAPEELIKYKDRINSKYKHIFKKFSF